MKMKKEQPCINLPARVRQIVYGPKRVEAESCAPSCTFRNRQPRGVASCDTDEWCLTRAYNDVSKSYQLMSVLSPSLSPRKGQLKPPNPPWRDLRPRPEADSYLCFYYGSPISARPVRDINRILPVENGGFVADCKVDPNWETGTFGLFSTCQQDVRRGVVRNHAPYLFFFTNRLGCRTIRAVSGYYRLRWYADGGTSEGDFCLAAEKMHFLERAIAFDEVNRAVGTNLSNRVPRLAIKLTPDRTARLVALIERQPDATGSYITELRRLEQINARNSGGLKYINFARRASYGWDAAAAVLKLGVPSVRRRRKNTNPSNTWECTKCQHRHRSRSLLKLCPACGAHGTLQPF